MAEHEVSAPVAAKTAAVFHEGDFALCIDRKSRRFLLTLRQDGSFHTHMGFIPHSEIIGKPPGGWFFTNSGHRFLAIRPTLADYVTEMPRLTQVIYPKDIGAIVMIADVFPGARVVEGGMGSGALTMALLRAVAPNGSVVSYEIRQGQAEKAYRNMANFVPNLPAHSVREQDIYDGIVERDVDRLTLDVPEPWRVVPSAADCLVPSGVFVSFLPTTLQVHRLVMALQEHGGFQMIDTVELMLRSWHVSEASMRPDHRMVAHTGFIVSARRCEPRRAAQSATAVYDSDNS